MKTAVEYLSYVYALQGAIYQDDIDKAIEMEQQQMLSFGKAVADYWGMMPVPMSNVKDLLNATKPTWRGNPDMNDAMNKTTDEKNKKISDLPLTMSMNDVFGGKDSCIVDAKSLGETTIEFPRQADLLVPKPNKPEPYNPNRAQLDTIEFRFYQEANCVDGAEDDSEELIVEAKSSLGIDGDGGAFYVLKTKQWAINDANEMSEILKRVEAAVAATNPTSVHTK